MIKVWMTGALVCLSLQAHAWGRRGHAIVCETAAFLLENEASFMKRHSYDLAYYCNSPDLAWRAPATSEIEGPQHFMDMEIFEKAFRSARPENAPALGTDPFSLSRTDFDAAYPSVSVKAGRAFWRIRELDDLLSETTHALKNAPAIDNKPRQLEWLVRAGTMGHYIGDLSMPLHLTEDYDGVKENQKGVHSFFEDASVDELYATTPLLITVRERAAKRWKLFAAEAKNKSVLSILEELAKQAGARKNELFQLDKKNGRGDLKRAAKAFEPMIQEQHIRAALALAAIWKRHDEVTFNEDHFYMFATTPDYIYPPKSHH